MPARPRPSLVGLPLIVALLVALLAVAASAMGGHGSGQPPSAAAAKDRARHQLLRGADPPPPSLAAPSVGVAASAVPAPRHGPRPDRSGRKAHGRPAARRGHGRSHR